MRVLHYAVADLLLHPVLFGQSRGASAFIWAFEHAPVINAGLKETQKRHRRDRGSSFDPFATRADPLFEVSARGDGAESMRPGPLLDTDYRHFILLCPCHMILFVSPVVLYSDE